jgi:hypothetical protein
LAKKYIVRLTEEERNDLESLIHKGKVAAHKRLHTEILLKADISELGTKWTGSQISEAFGISTRTVERVRERLVQEGIESVYGLLPFCKHFITSGLGYDCTRISGL